MEYSECNFFLKSLFNRQGNTVLIITFLITGALLLTLVGGVRIISVMFTSQKHMDVRNTMLTVRQNLETILKDGDAWANTVVHALNSELNCLQNSADCSGFTAFNGALVLRGATDNLFYDSRPAQNNGFTLAGDICTTYSSGVGNDICPIHVAIDWRAICLTPACTNPNVIAEIRGIFTYNPQSPQLRNIPAALSRHYDFIVRRTNVGSEIKNFIVVYEDPDDQTPGPPGEGICDGGTGVCNPGGGLDGVCRRLNKVLIDEGGNILNKDGANNLTGDGRTIQLRVGTYHCSITAPVYNIGRNRIKLINSGGTNVEINGITSYAGSGGGATITHIEGVFTLYEATNLKVFHICESSSGDQRELGIPAPNPNGTYDDPAKPIYTVMECDRVL